MQGLNFRLSPPHETLKSSTSIIHMATISSFRKMALSFPEVEEKPHFDRASFRIRKKIFATLLEKDKLAMVKLNPIDQSVYCSIDQSMIYPVPGGWGKTGATFIHLSKLPRELMLELLTKAYLGIAPKNVFGKLSSQVDSPAKKHGP